MKLSLRLAAVLALSIAATPATAQVVSVEVGVDPSCPYGLAA